VIKVHGVVEGGIGACRPRMERFPDVFRQLTGEPLFPGTLNIRIDRPLAIHEEFRIPPFPRSEGRPHA